ncbi:hypothetical protein K2173_013212 [Erythroxylum novogranatense]|uniref:Protein kinase domain-containing protein n=1 Tax=Erythroxylum novogranatense TaxID=1862640 RepID=A0AAV8SCP0_9ROSI|nr:hypothetical protein K2173_013212 [Erythroxylum novogranatense]
MFMLDENGNKMINEYICECKIGAGSYGKMVLYRSTVDGNQHEIQEKLRNSDIQDVSLGTEREASGKMHRNGVMFGKRIWRL